jgi:peptidoglycan/xylan/chitin deacetylase (PgdA/CDA1 family)
VTRALIYHDVAPSHEQDRCGFPGPVAARYKLQPAAFDAHLRAIAATGLSVGLIEDGPDLALTFDDGGASALAIAASLERRGWRGHFFVVTARIGASGFLDANGVRELVARGHSVGSHSHTHPGYMGRLSRAELAQEWRRSRDALSELIGAPARTAAVPGGFLSRALIEEAAAAGYEMLMTSTPTVRSHHVNGMLVHGRYTIWAGTSAQRVAAYARARWWAHATMSVAWRAKSASKRITPAGYEAVRRLVASRRSPR